MVLPVSLPFMSETLSFFVQIHYLLLSMFVKKRLRCVVSGAQEWGRMAST